MLQAAIFMAVALVSSLALWRLVAPTLADKQQAQPLRIPTDEELLRRKRQ